VGRDQLDVTDVAAVERAVGECDVVLHLAAFTAVDRAEREPELAHRVNAEGTRNVARACDASGAALLHVSTEMVFGEAPGRALREDDDRAPLNAYGRSKLIAEDYALSFSHRVVRTSWVFSPDSGFGAVVLGRARAGQPVRVVSDRVGTPTAAGQLAEALIELVERPDAPTGVLHVAGEQAGSWADVADHLLLGAGLPAVERVSASSWEAPAARAMDARLDCGRFQQWAGRSLHWRAAPP
jgi:dTDP-4-dehydrorhamnose reductase